MSKIKCVLFDVGGVLHNKNTRFWDDISQRLEASDKQMERIISEIVPDFGKGVIDEKTFWERVSKELSLPPVSADEELFSRAFVEDFKPTPNLDKVLDYLKDHDIKAAIYSNTIEPHVRFLRQQGLYDGFEAVFLSNEIGFRKPEIAGYKYVLGQLDLQPNEVLFIDDLPENVSAAESIGIKGLVLGDNSTLLGKVKETL